MPGATPDSSTAQARALVEQRVVRSHDHFCRNATGCDRSALFQRRGVKASGLLPTPSRSPRRLVSRHRTYWLVAEGAKIQGVNELQTTTHSPRNEHVWLLGRSPILSLMVLVAPGDGWGDGTLVDVSAGQKAHVSDSERATSGKSRRDICPQVFFFPFLFLFRFTPSSERSCGTGGDGR